MAVRPIVDTLRDLRKGAVLDELSTKLNEIVGAVILTGKAGTLTLKLKIKPLSSGAMIQVDDEIVAATPKLSTNGTVMFPTAENNLSRRDERQPELPGVALVEKAVSNG